MRSRTRLAIATGVIATLALLGGCPFFTSQGSGTVHLLITDKPFPFDLIDKAEITITKVEVHRSAEPNEPNQAAGQSEPNQSAGQSEPNQAALDQPASTGQADPNAASGTTAQNEPNEPNDAGGFVTIFAGTRTFDLLNLRNGRTDLLADAQIPAGTYDQMRLIVTRGTVTLKAAPGETPRTFDLRVPSGEQTGIKLHFRFAVQDQQQTQLLLDVDLSRAFRPVPAGQISDPNTIREFQFQPSIAMRLINLLEAGSIQGTVSDAAGGPVGSAAVTAYSGTTEVATTATEPNGTYVLTGLPTGTYRIEVSATGYPDASVENGSVTAGQATKSVDVVLSPA